MAQDYIHVRVDSGKKKEAERILNELGLNLTTGINLYLSGIIRAGGLPFDLKLNSREMLVDKAIDMETEFQNTAPGTIANDSACGCPAALCDTERDCFE